MSAPTQPSPQGLKLGRYELIARLGVGGMGEVWVARQKSIGGFERLVAVKRILPRFASDPSFVQRFATEAHVAASLSHPNIVQIHDLEEDRGEVFIAMELVRGETLQALIRRSWELTGQPIAPLLGAGIMARVCRALHHAHTRVDPTTGAVGLVHRDVAPANVLIGYRGEVKVVDFGIARALTGLAPAAGPLHAEGGSGAGRAAYMSPEQARGEELDARSDLFAAGILLWELVTGMRLFGGMEADETRRVIGGPEPVVLSERPGIDPELAAIARRALDKDRSRRFGDAGEMARALEARLVALGSPLEDEQIAALMGRLFRDQRERWAQLAGPIAPSAPVTSSPSAPVTPSPSAPVTLSPSAPVTSSPSAPVTLSPSAPVTSSPSAPVTSSPPAPETPSPSAPVETPAPALESTLPELLPVADATDPDAPIRPSSLLEDFGVAFDGEHTVADDVAPVFIDDIVPAPPEEVAPVAAPAPTAAPAPRATPLPFTVATFFKTRKAVTEGATWTVDVAMLWGDTVIASRTYAKPADVVIAEDEARADFALPAEVLGADHLRLLRATESGFALDVSHPGLRGDVLDAGGHVRDLAELAEEHETLRLEGAMRARLHIGDFTFLVARVPVAAAGPAAKAAVDHSALWFVLASALWHVALIAIMLNMPEDILMTTRDPRSARQKVMQALKITPEDLEEQKKAEAEEAKKDPAKKDPAHKDDLAVDKAAVPEAEPMAQPSRNPLVDRLHRAKKDARPELAPAMAPSQKAQLDELKQRLGGSGKDTSVKLQGIEAAPGETGAPAEVARVNGLVDGLPAGVTPSFVKEQGTAPSGPIAGNAGAEVNKKLLEGAPKTGQVRGKVTGMKSATKVSGSLDPGQVYDVIDKAIGRIQGCYETRLRVDGSLAGRITFRWTVTTSGAVGGVQQTASTVADPEVAACIKRVLQTLRFPKPDGGVVEVSYPFIFRSS